MGTILGREHSATGGKRGHQKPTKGRKTILVFFKRLERKKDPKEKGGGGN